MSWRREHLPQIVSALAQRPGHERVRTLVADVLRYAFQADYLGIDHEIRMPEVRGRADMLFGATVFEFKRDLRQELPDVLARLPDYLRERESGTGRRYLGIATDGATFIAYELRGGLLEEIARHATRAQDPDALLGWLEPALSDRDDITPDPLTIQRELGRSSLTFARASRLLTELWHVTLLKWRRPSVTFRRCTGRAATISGRSCCATLCGPCGCRVPTRGPMSCLAIRPGWLTAT